MAVREVRAMDWLLVSLLTAVLMATGGEGRGLELPSCEPGRSLGDKWFDGCHWCVCTERGIHCSRSQCSSLVRKVPACHSLGERWTDGCYRCRCKRHGIACRLDVTCLLLRHNPVPCLADERCVCGPDGVPSCTAEVIDRHAFAARRVDLGLPDLIPAEVTHERDESRMRSEDQWRHHRHQHHRGHGKKVLGGSRTTRELSGTLTSSTEELLITSDNLCRFGPRWYGGSLRCFCDMDGSITCGNPAFVSAFFDDFKVVRESCEEGHAWESGCSVCTCRVNGVVFCRRDHRCQRQLYNVQDGQDQFQNGVDHYLPGFHDDDEEDEVDPVPTRHTPGARSSTPGYAWFPAEVPGPRSTAGTPPRWMSCFPGQRWTVGCQHCHCDATGRQVCHRKHCSGLDTDDLTKEKDQGKGQGGSGHKDRKDRKDKEDNDAGGRQVTVKPSFVHRGPRGPMLVVPMPASIYRPPAYIHGLQDGLSSPCGRFRVGQKYWDDCNLCLCTSRGPKCQGRLCR